MNFLNEHDKKAHLKQDIENYMKLLFRKPVENATSQQLFQAVAYAVKDIVVDDWLETHKQMRKRMSKRFIICPWNFSWGAPWGT